MNHPPAVATTFLEIAEGLRAYVVADSVLNGRAMGGIRIAPNVTPEEVAALANKMSRKLALAELPIGGAKAGIVCELPLGPKRDALLRAFGRLAGLLLRGGVYLGSDMGCSYRDRDLIFTSAGYDITQTALTPSGAPALPCSWSELWAHCANITGHGVAHAVLAVAEARALPLSRKTVAIQGFGVVGRGAAQVLTAHGYTISAVADALGTIVRRDGLPIDELCAITTIQGLVDRRRLPSGCEVIDTPDAWLATDAGVLVLAAGADAIGSHNVERVSADLVAEGANLPTTRAAQQRLEQRGITVIPDILASVGGAMVTALFLCQQTPTGLPTSVLVKWLFDAVAARVRHNTQVAYARSLTAHDSLHSVCQELAEERAIARLHAAPSAPPAPPSS